MKGILKRFLVVVFIIAYILCTIVYGTLLVLEDIIRAILRVPVWILTEKNILTCVFDEGKLGKKTYMTKIFDKFNDYARKYEEYFDQNFL